MGGAKVSDKIVIWNASWTKLMLSSLAAPWRTLFVSHRATKWAKSFAERDEDKLELARRDPQNSGRQEHCVSPSGRHTSTRKNSKPTLPLSATEPWGEGGAVPPEREGIDIGDRAIKISPKSSPTREPSSGTDRWVCSRKKDSISARKRSVQRWRRMRLRRRSSVGADSVTAANQFGFGEKMDHMSHRRRREFGAARRQGIARYRGFG